MNIRLRKSSLPQKLEKELDDLMIYLFPFYYTLALNISKKYCNKMFLSHLKKCHRSYSFIKKNYIPLEPVTSNF